MMCANGVKKGLDVDGMMIVGAFLSGLERVWQSDRVPLSLLSGEKCLNGVGLLEMGEWL
jgi:hypothetical protein